MSNRFRAHTIRTRVSRLASVPLVVGLVLVVVLVWNVWPSVYLNLIVNGVRDASIPAVRALEQIQAERLDAMTYVSLRTLPQRAEEAGAVLQQQEKATDQALGVMNAAVAPTAGSAPPAIATAFAKLTAQLSQLPSQRDKLAAGTLSVRQVYDYFGDILKFAHDVFVAQTDIVPDPTTILGAQTAVSAFDATEAASKAAALIGTGLASHRLDPADHVEAAQLIGAYRDTWNTIASQLQPRARARYDALVASQAYQQLQDDENSVINNGPWTPASRALPITQDQWQSATSVVIPALAETTLDEADEVSGASATSALHSMVVLMAAAVLVIAVVVWMMVRALRTGRAIGARVTEMVSAVGERPQQMDMVVRRLESGETGTDQAVLPSLPHGQDELGDLARTLEHTERHLIEVVGKEAQTARAKAALSERLGLERDGVRRVVYHLTRRSQSQLDILLDNHKKLTDLVKDQDPDHLALVFDCDHRATQLWNLNDNLAVATGIERTVLGRRTSIKLHEIIDGAKSRAAQYKRIHTAVPRELAGRLVPPSVAQDLIIMLAALMDNATNNSAEHLPVSVTANIAARGITVEVSDRGLGMKPEQRDAVNSMMAEPPGFDHVLETGQLGLMVVGTLAHAREPQEPEIRVRFGNSLAGGELASVLIPWVYFVKSDASDAPLAPPDAAQSGSRIVWTEPPPQLADRAATVYLPAVSHREDVSESPQPGVRPKLAQRVPGAALAPAFDVDPKPEPDPDRLTGVLTPSADQVRVNYADIQAGTQRGREETNQ